MDSKRARGLRPGGWWLAAAVLAAVVLASVASAGAQEVLTISGRVVGPDGVTGIPGVAVSAVVTTLTVDYGSAVTDVDGYYTIEVDPSIPTTVAIAFDPGQSNIDNTTDYVGEFYGGADYLYGFGLIYVEAGATNVDTVLDIGGSISGTVYMPDGVNPLSGIEVGAHNYGFVPRAVTGPTGEYTIRGVHPGGVKARVSVDAYNELNDTDYIEASQSVPVSAGESTTGVNLTVGQGGRIRGTVTAGGAAIQGIRVYAYAGGGRSTYSLSDGTYVLRGVAPGPGCIVAFDAWEYNAANGTGYLYEYFRDTRDYMSAIPVLVVPGMPVSSVDADLETGGSISGNVYGPDGETGLTGVTVTGHMGFQWVSGVTGAGGAYTLQGLTTGDARVEFDPSSYNAANDTSYGRQFYNGKPDYMSADLVPVTLGEETAGINATLAEMPPAGTIAGRVLGPDETTPIAGIKVLVDGPTPTYTYTDFVGGYSLPNLTPGDYTVTVDPTDYNGLHSPTLEGQTLPATIEVLDDQVSTVDDLALGASGYIAGHVYAADGTTAVAGISVQALDSMGMPLTTTTTDANGFYLLPAWGSTLIWYSPYDYNIMNGTAFVAEYYDNQQYWYMANAVSPGSVGIDASLAQSGSISGTVFAADGVTPLEGIDVWAGWMASDTTDENGEYKITDLAPGTYGVRFNADTYNTTHTPVLEEWYEDTYFQWSATSVRVRDGVDTPDIDATLDVASIITGTVTSIDQPAGLSGVHVNVTSTGSPSWSDSFMTGLGGVYTAYVPQGTYTVSFNPSDYNQWNGTAYVGESWQDVHSGTATPVVVGAEATVTGINAELEIGGAIRGVVTDPDGLGIAGVQVMAYPAGGPPMGITTYTTTGGAYNLRGLNAGDYTVSFDPFSYNMMNGTHLLNEYYLDARLSAAAQPVPVALGQETPDINAQLELSGSISGTVYAADGTTRLSGVRVEAMGDGFGSGSSATTDANGVFTVWGLIDGNYRVQFDPAESNNANTTDYIGEYYNGQSDYLSATLVPVTVSNNTSPIDATLESGGSISGTVYGSDGQPAAEVSVTAEGGGGGGSAASGDDGTYVIHGLAPGTYAVRFDPMMHNWYYDDGLLSEYFDGAPEWQLAAPVGVSVGEDTGSIDATLRQGAMITGIVYGPDGTSELQGVQAEARSTDGSVWESDQTDADGRYTIKGLPTGSYTVQFTTWFHNDMYGARLLAEYYEDTRDEDQAATRWLEPGETWSGVDATLEEGATLSGTVTGDGGAKLGGISVRLTDPVTDVEIWAGTNASGVWTANAVPPGAYILEFDPSDYNNTNDSSYVREFWSDKAGFWEADPVSVSLAETRSDLSAQLVQGGLALTANIGGLPAGAGDSYQWVDLYERLADGRERYLTSIETVSVPEGETNSIQFRGLTPGDYLLRAEVNGETWGGVWAYDQQPTAPQYSGATPIAEQYRMSFADAISMTTGDRTVTMNAPDFGTISGSVTDPDGAPLSEIRVDFMRQAPDGTWVPVEWSGTLSDGTFECQLVPGDYKVFYSDEYNVWFAQSVWHLDAPGETEARAIPLAPGGTVDLETQVMQIGGGPGLMTNVEADPVMPDGGMGWYKTAPTVTLTCTDPSATIWYYWGTDAPAEYTDPLTAPEGTSSLTAYAEDTLGNLEPEHTWDFNVDTTAPDAPTGLMVTGTGENSVDLHWDTGFDATSGIDYYKIYKDGVYVAQNSLTDHQVVELEAGTTYSFTVTAVDWAGNESAASAPAEATTSGGTSAVPVYRLYSTYSGGVLYTDDPVEMGALLADQPDTYVFDGIAFFTDPALDTVSMWRFYKPASDTYMYTSSIAERDLIISLFSGTFTYQGEAFKFDSSADGSSQLYRFSRPAAGDVLLTASIAERDMIMATYPSTFVYEGVAGSVNGGPTLASGTGTISGTVTDSADQPLAGLWVRATSDNGTWSGFTGPDGQYTIAGLPSGDFTITFSTWPNTTMSGWYLPPEYYPDQPLFENAGAVTLSEGQSVENTDAQLGTLGPDTTKPITQISASGTLGLDGWYSTEPSITLTPNEPATTYYSWDGIEEHEFVGPTIKAPLGISTLWFRSVDLAGNAETTQTATYKYDGIRPTAPADVTATQVDTAGNVDVSWTTSSDEYSGVYRYVILELNGAIWVPLADFAPEVGPTQTESVGVLSEGGHTLCVLAVDTAGNYSVNSDSDYVSVDTSPPTTLIWLGGGATGSAGWYTMSPTITLDSAEPGCTTYYYWGTDAPSEYAGPFTAPEGVNTLSFWSVDAIGNTEVPAKTREFTVDSVAPAAPALVTATAAGENAIDVSWSAVTDDMDGGADASGITLYGVYVDGMWLADTSDTSYQVTGLDQNTTYEIAITALDVAGNEGPSASDTATTDADLTAPTTAIDLADGIEGENGWYTAPPTITLTSSEEGTTWYQWGTEDSAVYSDPLIAPDGVNTLAFWSQDVYGNTETPPQTATFSVDGIAPATPTGLSATSVGLDTVDLAWDAVTLDDLGSPDISGIALYRVYGGPEVYETEETSFQVPGLDQGSGYSFLVTAVDTAGNEGIGADLPVTTEHETTPPTTALTLTGGTAGLNGWYTAAPSITLTPDEDGTTWYQWDTDATETGYAGSFLAITGEHTLSYYSVDVWGNTEDPQTSTFKLDTSAPATPTGLTAEQTAPGTVTISWNAASDSESGMYTHALIQSGPQNMGWSVPGATYTATGLAAGTYTYTIEAINNAGLRSATSAAVEVTVDNTAPSTELSVDPVDPGGANGWYTTAPAITLTADESGTTWYAWDAGTPTEYTGAFSPSVGEHTLTYWSVDAVGNTEDEHQVAFKLDTTAPLAPLGVTASQTAPSIVNVMWGAGVDTQSGVDHYVLCEWNGSAWIAIDSAIPSTSSSYQLSSVSGGAHRYCIRSVNGAGVTSTESNAADVTVDNTAPVTTLSTAPVSPNGLNDWFTTAPTITLTADDLSAAISYRWGAGSPVDYIGPFAAPQGAGTLSYWSIDAIGNTETPAKTADFKVDSVGPAAPTGLNASAAGQTAIDFSWSAVTEDADGGADTSGIDHYSVYLDGSWLVDVTGTSYQVTGLTQNTTHDLGVVAVDAAGTQSLSSTDTATTDADTDPPATTITLTGGTAGLNGWYTSWPMITLTSDEPGTTSFMWDGGTTVPYTGGFTYNDGEHTLTYWSVDSAGNTEDPKPTQAFKVDTVAPRMPDAPTFVAGETTIDLSWTAVTEDADGGVDSSGIVGYRVYQGATKIADVTAPGTTYRVTGLIPSTGYSFTIAAVDGAGHEGAQSGATAATTAADTTAPAAPTGLTAVASGQTAIVLSWNAATDPSGIAKYTVYYADGTKIADVAAPTTSFTVTGLSAKTAYSFYVKAEDTAGNLSAASASAGATTQAPAPPQLRPIYRFYNVTNGTHFFTDSAGERDMVIAKWPNIYNYEGEAYFTNPANNTQPLTRLYNKVSGSHFYTSSPGEAASALAKWPNVFSLDGLTYAVNPGPVANSIPVYRFYNLRNGSHFYTASESEKNTVIAKWPNVYQFEGPAFWLGQ